MTEIPNEERSLVHRKAQWRMNIRSFTIQASETIAKTKNSDIRHEEMPFLTEIAAIYKDIEMYEKELRVDLSSFKEELRQDSLRIWKQKLTQQGIKESEVLSALLGAQAANTDEKQFNILEEMIPSSIFALVQQIRANISKLFF